MNDEKNTINVSVASSEKSADKKYKKIDFVALVICLLVSIGIWIYVMNMNQSVVDKTITITIDANGEIMDAMGMSIFSNIDGTFESGEMDYSKLRVQLTVTGLQKVLDRYTDSDYSVRVDVSDIEGGAVQRLPLVYMLPSEEISFKSMTTSLPIEAVYIDKPATVYLTNIDAEIEGVPPAGEISITPLVGTIEISGPEKTIKSITRAELSVNLAGYDKSTTVKTNTVRFFGNEGEIKSSYIKVKTSDMHAKVLIVTEKKFPIIVKQSTVVSGDYKYTVILTGETVDLMLKGDSALLEGTEVVLDLGDITALEEMTGKVSLSELKILNGGEDVSDKLAFAQTTEGIFVSYTVTKEPISGDGGSSATVES